MNSAPTVSVIIPSYNQGHYLADAIASVSEQSYSNTEIIVVDDGSCDETQAVALQHSDKVHYIFQTNRGVSAARNAGIACSTGAYILFLDADDKIEKHKILTHVAYLEDHPDTGIVYSDVRYFTNKNPGMRSYGPAEYGMDWPWVRGLWKAPGSMLMKFASQNLMAVNCAVVRRQVVDVVGPWNEELRGTEDWEYWIRCAAKGTNFHFEEKSGTLALVRMHESSASRDRKMMNADNFRMHLIVSRIVRDAEFRSANFEAALSCMQTLGPEGRALRLWEVTTAYRSVRGAVAALMLWLFGRHGPGYAVRLLIVPFLPSSLKKIFRRLTADTSRHISNLPSYSSTSAAAAIPHVSSENALEARLIAFYLPQFHSIPENDEWWGKGFTDWTNVTRARPLFPGHYQPHLPADLGFYDLRVAEFREAQAELAREYGIHGFCYYHYWFNGRGILERPFNEVLASGKPEIPFCLCWANESWTRRWDGQERDVLLAQNYSPEDDLAHINSLLPALRDPRYICVDGKPLLIIYRIGDLPDPQATIERWRAAAYNAGLPGLFLCNVESVASEHGLASSLGVDAAVEFSPDWTQLPPAIERGGLNVLQYWLRHRRRRPQAFLQHHVADYEQLATNMMAKREPPYLRFPAVTPMWDNTARRQTGGTVLENSSPVVYERWLRHAIEQVRDRPADKRIVFINAWNEWGEGNHLEPCQRWGRAYLEATRSALQSAR